MRKLCLLLAVLSLAGCASVPCVDENGKEISCPKEPREPREPRIRELTEEDYGGC